MLVWVSERGTRQCHYEGQGGTRARPVQSHSSWLLLPVAENGQAAPKSAFLVGTSSSSVEEKPQQAVGAKIIHDIHT